MHIALSINNNDSILTRIYRYEKSDPKGLNGFHLLIHVGTDPKRTEKLYYRLPGLNKSLKTKRYQFKEIGFSEYFY